MWTNPEYLKELHLELHRCFKYTSSWLKGYYLCQRILDNANLCPDKDLVRKAMHLSLGRWTEGVSKCSPWPARNDEYLAHWHPLMAFGGTEKVLDEQIKQTLVAGASAVLCGQLKSDRIEELRRRLGKAA